MAARLSERFFAFMCLATTAKSREASKAEFAIEFEAVDFEAAKRIVTFGYTDGALAFAYARCIRRFAFYRSVDYRDLTCYMIDYVDCTGFTGVFC